MKFIELSYRVEFHCNKDCDLLLNEIALAEQQNDPLTVMRAMNLRWIASQATVHRRLNELLKNGYIVHTFKGENRRTKFISITPKAQSYFKELEKCLFHSVR
jgi:DNA-binding MarR family transcriptional regulator